MKYSIFFLLVAAALTIFLPSCYLINFEKEIEFELTFDVDGNRNPIEISHLVDLNEYSTDFQEYRQYIEDIELISIECSLNEFQGSSAQTLTHAILTVSDESGNGATVLAIIPELSLEQLYIDGRELDLEPSGKQRVEELIMTDPNKCLGMFTGEVNELPSRFIIIFHIKAVIRGSLV